MIRLLKRLFIRSYPLLSHLLPNRYIAYPFPGGRIYLNLHESPMMVKRAIGFYEKEKMKVLRASLKPGMIFVDAGANKGYFTLTAARIVGAQGRVITFEPEPTNCGWIEKSIARNGYENITLHRIALGHANEESPLYLSDKSGWHTLVASSDRGTEDNKGIITVTKRTLDSILEEHDLPTVDVMKVDVEGSELDLLRGATHTLSAASSMIMVMDLHPQLGVDTREVGGLLRGLGFSLHELREPYRELRTLEPDRREVLARRGEIAL